MESRPATLVRCANCAWNFEAKGFGNITCPSCRAQIWLDPPDHAEGYTEGIPEEFPDTGIPGSNPDTPGPEMQPYEANPIPAPERLGPLLEAPSDLSDREDLAPNVPAWESSRGNLPARFVETIKEVMLNPFRFFAGLPSTGYRKPLGFAWFIGTIAVLSFSFYGMLQLDKAQETLTQTQTNSDDQNQTQDPKQTIESLRGVMLLSLYAAPILGLINLLISSLLYHIGVLLLSTQHLNFTATFRATAYSTAPLLLGAIPFIGYLLGGLWSLAIQVIAISQTHHMGMARAVVVVLWPITMVLLLLNAMY